MHFQDMLFLKTVSGAISDTETFTSNISGSSGSVTNFTAPLLKYASSATAMEVGDTVTFSGGTTAVVAKSDPLTGSGTIDEKNYN